MKFVAESELLIEGLHKGEEKSIRTLYAMHYRPLCYFAENIIHNKSEAEDIAVESFLELLKKKTDFDNLADIKSFLFTVIRNACIDYLRKQKIRTQNNTKLSYLYASEELPVEYEMITAQLLQSVYAEIEHLPGQCKKVFKSFFIEGKTTAIIAEEMGIKPQTVLNQKVKALRLLRFMLLKEGLQYSGSLIFIFLTPTL